HPLWINRHFLEQAEFRNGKLEVGDAAFSSLYVDVKYMDVRALRRILALAKQGLHVCWKNDPDQPGKVKSKDFATTLQELKALKNVSADFAKTVQRAPLIQGDSIPEYWCRVAADGTHYLFLAQMKSKHLKYPIYSGQSIMEVSDFKTVTLHINGKKIQQRLEFKPYQSLLLKISLNGEMEYMDIAFVPKEPIVRPKEKQRMNF
ncbi:MAG: hypothetical protein AAF573_14665, partial [Bacteroidota bacterium]